MSLLIMHEVNFPPSQFCAIARDGSYIDIETRLLDYSNDKEVVDLARFMAKAFSSIEPMTVSSGLTEEDMYKEILMYIRTAYKDNLIVISINKKKGSVIGGIIGRDFANDEAEDPFIELENKEKYEAIFKFLDTSKAKFVKYINKEGYALEPGLAYRGFFIGFSPKYLSLKNEMGVSLPLFVFRQTEIFLKDLGYKYLYGEATNPGSQNLFRSSGWNIDNITVPFQDHPVFGGINFKKRAIEGVGNSLSGAYTKVHDQFIDLPNSHVENYRYNSPLQFGFPHNLDINFSRYAEYLDYHINNAGDPKNHSNYKLHARNEESAVLNFFSRAYGLSPKHMWGYITSGGMEANEMGVYLARAKYPNGVIYASKDSHYSIRVIADKLRMSLVEVPTLYNGEVDYIKLEKLLSREKMPVVFILNLGTTMKGATDKGERVSGILNRTHSDCHYIHCDAALHGGFLPFINRKYSNYLEEGVADSLCISIHKFMGLPFPAGILLTKKELVDFLPKDLVNTRYNGKKVHTLACSRNGLAALLAYNRILQLGGDAGFRSIANSCIENARYLSCRLNSIKYPGVLINEDSNIVLFSTPPRSFYKRWQLAVNGDSSHVVVLPHITKESIDQFVLELRECNSYEEDLCDNNLSNFSQNQGVL